MELLTGCQLDPSWDAHHHGSCFLSKTSYYCDSLLYSDVLRLKARVNNDNSPQSAYKTYKYSLVVSIRHGRQIWVVLGKWLPTSERLLADHSAGNKYHVIIRYICTT